MKNKHLNNLALTISFLGSPFIVLVLMFLALAWRYKEGVEQFYSYLVVTMTFVLIIPLAYMMENIPNFHFIDLHLTKREDREKVLLVSIFSVLIGYFMLSFIGVPKSLLLVELVCLFNLIIIAMITFKMKLSIHLAVLTIATTLVIYFLGYQYSWLYLLLIPLCWARLYREKHDMKEIITGIFISLIVTFVIISIFMSL